jgi:hypothetical protein
MWHDMKGRDTLSYIKESEFSELHGFILVLCPNFLIPLVLFNQVQCCSLDTKCLPNCMCTGLFPSVAQKVELDGSL